MECPCCCSRKDEFLCAHCIDRTLSSLRKSLRRALKTAKANERLVDEKHAQHAYPSPESTAAATVACRNRALSAAIVLKEKELVEQRLRCDQLRGRLFRRRQYLQQGTRKLSGCQARLEKDAAKQARRDTKEYSEDINLASRVDRARRKLVAGLFRLFPVHRRDQSSCVIAGLPLPDDPGVLLALFRDKSGDSIQHHATAALARVVHVVRLASRYLGCEVLHPLGMTADGEGTVALFDQERVVALQNGDAATKARQLGQQPSQHGNRRPSKQTKTAGDQLAPKQAHEDQQGQVQPDQQQKQKQQLRRKHSHEQQEQQHKQQQLKQPAQKTVADASVGGRPNCITLSPQESPELLQLGLKLLSRNLKHLLDCARVTSSASLSLQLLPALMALAFEYAPRSMQPQDLNQPQGRRSPEDRRPSQHELRGPPRIHHHQQEHEQQTRRHPRGLLSQPRTRAWSSSARDLANHDPWADSWEEPG